MYLRVGWILSSMARAGVPESWLPKLATLKAAGAVGLPGLVIPFIGLGRGSPRPANRHVSTSALMRREVRQ